MNGIRGLLRVIRVLPESWVECGADIPEKGRLCKVFLDQSLRTVPGYFPG
jgi:hypothetical protein